jgi:ABC-type glycerol-3-phosphate transport system substrate-binding protein
MKSAKRALAIALCAALMAGACVGCKKSDSTSSAGGNTTTGNTASSKKWGAEEV